MDPLEPKILPGLMILPLLAFLTACNGPEAWKRPIGDAVMKTPSADAGAATPGELANLYLAAHKKNDRKALRRIDSQLVLLRDWVPTPTRVHDELTTLFSFELDRVRFLEYPPKPPMDRLAFYLYRNPDGAPALTQSTIGLSVAGKLVLAGRWPGGPPLELDPGLAVVQGQTASLRRYFVDRNPTIGAALLAKAETERSDGSSDFRALPLGVDANSAVLLPGTRREGKYSKTWDEATAELREIEARMANSQPTAQPDRPTEGAASVDELVALYSAAHRAHDPGRLRDRIEWNLGKLPAWAQVPTAKTEAIDRLFALPLQNAHLQRLPPGTNQVMYLGPRGARFLKLVQVGDGLNAIGKLILTVRDSGGTPTPIDPGLVVIHPTEPGNRYYLVMEERVTRSAVSTLQGEPSPEYRPLPLGLDPNTASQLLTKPGPGQLGEIRVQKNWEEANRAFDDHQRTLAAR